MKSFSLIWLGQLLSGLGSGLSRFVIGVWVYQQSGSTTMFALSLLCGSLPQILLLPIAGAYADRWDRRIILLVTNAGAALLTVLLYALLAGGGLQIWHVWVISAVGASLGAFQLPAMSAVTVMLLPRSRLGRASGMVEMANSIPLTLAPVLATALLARFGFDRVILFDLISFVPALLSLWIVTIPRVAAAARARNFWDDVMFGSRFLARHGALLILIVYVAALNFALNFAWILLTPFVLRVATPTELGTISSVAGFGLVLGGVVLTAWGGPTRRVAGVFAAGGGFAVALVAAGLRPSLQLVGASFFVMFFSLPLLNGCARTLVQERIPVESLGRVWAAIQMAVRLGLPIASLSAGPLADDLFEPLLARNGGPLAVVGAVIGHGPGRGIGLMYIILGLAALGFTIWSAMSPRMWLLHKLPEQAGDLLDARSTAR
jgi:DHA3 family macrolide efflux protein-like MFS transporter